jgi:hypothetical protein
VVRRTGGGGDDGEHYRRKRAIQFAVTKFLATSSQVP